MDTIESVLKILSSYPTWAKTLMIGNIACVVAVMVFVPRISETKERKQSDNSYELRIERVELFPHIEFAVARLVSEDVV